MEPVFPIINCGYQIRSFLSILFSSRVQIHGDENLGRELHL